MNPRSTRRALLAVGALLWAAGTVAGETRSPAIDVHHPWARPTVSGQQAGGGFLRIDNRTGVADRLLSARSPAAERVELHAMSMDGDVMRMRQIDGIDLPPGQSVELKPGGLHLMFMGLKQPLKAGARFSLTLRFEKAGEVPVTVQVENPSTAQPAAHRH
jgi:copper(I)-binding protein